MKKNVYLHSLIQIPNGTPVMPNLIHRPHAGSNKEDKDLNYVTKLLPHYLSKQYFAILESLHNTVLWDGEFTPDKKYYIKGGALRSKDIP